MSSSCQNARNAPVVLRDTLPIRWPFYMAFFLVLGVAGIVLQMLLEAPIMAPAMAILLLGAWWMIWHESHQTTRTDVQFLDGMTCYPILWQMFVVFTFVPFLLGYTFEQTDFVRSMHAIISILATTALGAYTCMRLGQFHLSRRSIFHVHHMLTSSTASATHLDTLKKVLFHEPQIVILPIEKDEKALLLWNYHSRGWVNVLQNIYRDEEGKVYVKTTGGRTYLFSDEYSQLMQFLVLYVLSETLNISVGLLLGSSENVLYSIRNEQDLCRIKEQYDILGSSVLNSSGDDALPETFLYI